MPLSCTEDEPLRSLARTAQCMPSVLTHDGDVRSSSPTETNATFRCCLNTDLRYLSTRSGATKEIQMK